jgi:hypothetical protein
MKNWIGAVCVASIRILARRKRKLLEDRLLARIPGDV